MNKLTPGSLCIVDFPISAVGMFGDQTRTSNLLPGEIFILLDSLEIDELSVIEVQILFENKQMWFNIHKNEFNIDNVRRAASYDIPFMALQETESGSNTLIS